MIGRELFVAHSNDEGLGLFDDAASAAGNFPSALRGYDRTAVDDYVRSLEAALVQARQQTTALERQLRALQAELARVKTLVPDDDVSKVGGRTSEILALAEEKAQEMVDSATVQAEQIKGQAQREADQSRRDAVREGAELRSSGLAEIERLRQQLAGDT